MLSLFSETPPPRGADLRSSLLRAAARRRGIFRPGVTTALRLVHTGEIDPASVAVDLYGEHAVLHAFSDEAEIERVVACLIDLGLRGVYAKFRPRQANTLADTRRDEVAPRLPLAGVEAPDPAQIVEEGVPYWVRLGDGLSTGIFLDQRANRALVRSLARGRRSLNLFSYACAISVCAALGGAASVTSVDISKQALAWGQDNLRLSGLDDPARYRFVADEAITFLRRCAVRGDRYDLILLDPPSYATTKTTRFTAEHDYGSLIAAALSVTAPGGKILACTNHRGISAPRFQRTLREALARAGRAADELRLLPPPADFPEPPGAEPHLKSALLTAR